MNRATAPGEHGEGKGYDECGLGARRRMRMHVGHQECCVHGVWDLGRATKRCRWSSSTYMWAQQLLCTLLAAHLHGLPRVIDAPDWDHGKTHLRLVAAQHILRERAELAGVTTP